MFISENDLPKKTKNTRTKCFHAFMCYGSCGPFAISKFNSLKITHTHTQTITTATTVQNGMKFVVVQLLNEMRE